LLLAEEVEFLLHAAVGKLKITASSTAVCTQVSQLGTTKMSCGCQSNVWPPISLLPLPSTTMNTVFAVERYGLVAMPFGNSCMQVASVGIASSPLMGLT
jgi:hypothetical protein